MLCPTQIWIFYWAVQGSLHISHDSHINQEPYQAGRRSWAAADCSCRAAVTLSAGDMQQPRLSAICVFISAQTKQRFRFLYIYIYSVYLTLGSQILSQALPAFLVYYRTPKPLCLNLGKLCLESLFMASKIPHFRLGNICAIINKVMQYHLP